FLDKSSDLQTASSVSIGRNDENFTFQELNTVSDWTFAQSEPAQELAQLTFYSVKRQQDGKTIEFVITVREFASRNHLGMLFYAEADKQTNQKTAPFTPCGWGDTLMHALRSCVESVHRFPYEGP